MCGWRIGTVCARRQACIFSEGVPCFVIWLVDPTTLAQRGTVRIESPSALCPVGRRTGQGAGLRGRQRSSRHGKFLPAGRHHRLPFTCLPWLRAYYLVCLPPSLPANTYLHRLRRRHRRLSLDLTLRSLSPSPSLRGPHRRRRSLGDICPPFPPLPHRSLHTNNTTNTTTTAARTTTTAQPRPRARLDVQQPALQTQHLRGPRRSCQPGCPRLQGLRQSF